MALFTLTDIKFQSKDLSSSSPLQSFYPGTYRYPEDIGGRDKGHYMIFNIFVQKNSKMATTAATRPGLNKTGINRLLTGEVNAGTAINALTNISGTVAGTKMFQDVQSAIASFKNKATDKIGNDTFTSGVNQTIDSIGNAFSRLGELNSVNFNNNVVQLQDNIALYMPNTLAFQQGAMYNTPELSGQFLSNAAIIKSLYDEHKAGNSNATTNGAAFLGSILKDKSGILQLNGSAVDTAFVSAFGVKNPMIEVVYSRPQLREFMFDFLMYPRSESEAIQVQKILETFRYHQAPEILSGSGGAFLVPPSVFDIEFNYNGRRNPNIPEIATCVLRNINVDYAPNGFQAYESDSDTPKFGGTGMPVGIRLSLNFQETQFMTKEILGLENKQNMAMQQGRSEVTFTPATPVNDKSLGKPGAFNDRTEIA